MPIGLVAPQPLNAGIAPSNIVTPEQSVLNPDAITSLVDSFHKGVITGNDLADHVGLVAAAKNKSMIQQMREYVSPQAIAARQSSLDAQTAQNQLATAGAQAQTGLVQPSTKLAATKIGAEEAATVEGPQGLQAIQQYGPWYGETVDDFRKPDGSMDFMAAAKRGNEMSAQMNLANMWISRLTPAATKTYKDAAGGEHTYQVNSFGIDVTPPQPERGFGGSPAYWSYVKELNQYLPDFHPARGQFMMKPDKSAAGAASPPAHPDESAALVSPNAAPSNTSVPPMVEPSSGVGIVTAEPKGSYQTPAEIRTGLVQDPIVKTLLEQQKYAVNFKTIADAQEQQGATVPGSKVPPQNANDIGLAESIVKLYDPQAAIREFKWDKLEEAQPWLEKIGAWKQLALHQGSFTPESRQRLIRMGDEIINGMETAARGRLQIANSTASSSAKIAGQDPSDWANQTLTSDEQRILRGDPFRKSLQPTASAAAPATAAAANSQVVILQTGPYAGRRYDKATGTILP